jgi:biopolymer transport protein ExbD
MILQSQTLRPKTFHHHLVARRNRRAALKKHLVVGLSLTSMVDMFSLLVIFLLQTFSTSPEVATISQGIVLPSASTGTEVVDAPQLTITQDGVFLDQKALGKLDDVLKKPKPLLEKLESLREVWMKTHPGASFAGEINLQAHQALSGIVVSQMMGLISGQHYGSIRLTVIPGG